MQRSPELGHLILVRHGESELNAANKGTDNRFCGQLDCPLTELGRAQASNVGKSISRSSISVDWAVSSSLSRATETLTLLARELSCSPRILPPQAGFNERSLGIFEGRSESEVFLEHPKYLSHPEFKSFRKHFEQRAPGGENLSEVTERVWSTWESLRQRVSGNGLIVAHGVSLQAFLGRALELSNAETLSIRVSNATPIILRYWFCDQASASQPKYELIDSEQPSLDSAEH